MATHLLLTGLGLYPRAGTYELDGRTCQSILSPAALFQLLAADKRPDGVVAFCTREARSETFPQLERLVGSLAKVEAVEAPPGISADELDTFLRVMVQTVAGRGADRLTLDLTQGPRHFALLLYVGALYLQSLGKTAIEAAYYAYEFGDPRPFFDLKQLLALPRWIHAIGSLTEARDATPMAVLLAGTGGGDLANPMRRLTEAFSSGLPLELGREVTLLVDEKLKPLRRSLERHHALPLGGELTERLESWLVRYRLPARPRGEGWKGAARLTEEELRRQALLIDDLVEHNNLRSALGLMEEWVVSWALVRLGSEEKWLDFESGRRPASQRLGALVRIQQDPQLRSRLTPDQVRLAEFWQDLTDVRNSLAHHGMRRQVISSADPGFGARLKRVLAYWRETMRQIPPVPLEVAPRAFGRLLVSPVGERPGVLFTAARTALKQPGGLNGVIAICSDRTEPFVVEALAQAGFAGPLVPLRFEDPFGGVGERALLLARARPHLAEAAEVLVNVTGGTTLMGLLAEQLAAEARALAVPVRRFGLIDRRPSGEQSRQPYVEGEVLWLDGEAPAQPAL